MPLGKHIHSEKWTHVIHLYDDGEYSAVWGNFTNPFSRCLGVRWNEAFGAAGYPSHGQYPLWYAEPAWLAKMILLELADRVNRNPEHGNLENILTALKECPEGERRFETEREMRSMKKREPPEAFPKLQFLEKLPLPANRKPLISTCPSALTPVATALKLSPLTAIRKAANMLT